MSTNLDTEIRIKSHFIQKHDLEVNWNKATGFVPSKGQLIVYDIEIDKDGNTLKDTEGKLLLPEGRTTPYTYERIKIGDGIKIVSELPFVDTTSLKYIEQELTEAQKAQARANIDAASKKYVDESVATKTSVTVGGVHQETFDADTKVSKIAANSTGAYKVYIANPDGRVSGYYLQTSTSTTTDYCIPMYRTSDFGKSSVNGKLVTGIPAQPYDATNKKYVDDALALKTSVIVGGVHQETFDSDTKLDKMSGTGDVRLYARGADGKQTNRLVGTSASAIESGVIPQYFSSSTTIGSTVIGSKLLCGDPTLDYHAANKHYVDDTVAAMGDTKYTKLAVNNSYDIVPFVGFGTDYLNYKVLAGSSAAVYGNRIPTYLSSSSTRTVPANGWLVSATPIQEGDCTNKKYVDDALALKTSVTVGGVHQETFDADTKLTIPTSTSQYIRIYGAAANQAPTTTPQMYNIAPNANLNYTSNSQWAIPRYNPGIMSNSETTMKATLATGTPTHAVHAANKKYVDDNFIAKIAESQTITGNLAITGNLQVQGTTETVNAVTYKIDNNIIEFNPDKIYNELWLTGLAINKGLNGETDLGTYGIMYDPSTDAVKLGFGQVDEENKFKFNENESAPIATREEFEDSWKDDAIFVFDKATKKFKYSGKTFASFEEEITTKMRLEMATYVADYVETYMSDIEIEHDDGTIETVSNMLFATGTAEEKNNGTELWIEGINR